eukprot:7446506-Alexandrium_andersonii.AAC.1
MPGRTLVRTLAAGVGAEGWAGTATPTTGSARTSPSTGTTSPGARTLVGTPTPRAVGAGAE